MLVTRNVFKGSTRSEVMNAKAYIFTEFNT
jgi:hypothetical protein